MSSATSQSYESVRTADGEVGVVDEREDEESDGDIPGATMGWE